MKILSLSDDLVTAEERRAPNVLCDAVFDLSQRFSRFYTEHHIMSETDTHVRAARLGMAALTLAMIERLLTLLGIEIPERM